MGGIMREKAKRSLVEFHVKEFLTQKRIIVYMIILFLLAMILYIRPSSPVQAQSNITATVSPTIDPAIVVLENKLATQQVQIDDLTRNLTNETHDREYYDRDLQWRWGILAAIATAVISILTWLGVSNFKEIQTKWEIRSNKILDKAIYKIDLGKLPIFLPVGEKIENIYTLLQHRKFEKMIFYESLDECGSGIIVLSLRDKNIQEQTEILQKMETFIDTKHPSSSDTGIIIFAPGDIKVAPKYMNCFENLVTAKYPATVVSDIFVVGRGMDITPPEQMAKENA
jgi:hypothetical protein